MQQLLEQELVHEDESFDATPVCGGNFQTPVADMADVRLSKTLIN